jgi:hypothetical protein
VNPALPDEAADFAAAADKAFTNLGGIECARRAEEDPEVRAGAVAAALESLGIDDVDPRRDVDAAASAGELCRVAGRNALPYPLVARMLRQPGDGTPLALSVRPDSPAGPGRPGRADSPAGPGRPGRADSPAGPGRPGRGERPENSARPRGAGRVEHGDVFPAWTLAGLDGSGSTAAASGPRLASKLGPFVIGMATIAPGCAPVPVWDVALHLTLTAWRVLGFVERALELAVAHVTNRVQFGQALSKFQAVQFQLADASVATDGLRELCRYTVWRAHQDRDGALADALGLRLFALDTARSVLRTSQQLHGAAGLCDEYDISILCRHVQAELRLPFGAERTAAELFDAGARLGFESLFPHGTRR